MYLTTAEIIFLLLQGVQLSQLFLYTCFEADQLVRGHQVVLLF